MAYGQTNPNGLKTYPSLRMGTPELTWIYITADSGGTWNDEGEYIESDSNFSRAINAIERYCDIYNIDQPDASTFAVQVRADSVPLGAGEELDSGDSITVLSNAISEKVGFSVTASAEVLALTPPAPPFNPAEDYPVPGPTSGAWKTAATALNGVTFATYGTPTEPGSYKTLVEAQYFAPGIRRAKYNGNFCANALSAVGTWDFAWFDNNFSNFIKEIIDTTPGWGNQSDGAGFGEFNFSIQWTGYFKVPTTQNYNIYGESDDLIGVWVGSNAVSGFDNTNVLFASSNKSLPGNAGLAGQTRGNTLTLDANRWYPIRIFYSEFLGGCKAQLYFHGEDGTKLGVENISWCYNTQGLY